MPSAATQRWRMAHHEIVHLGGGQQGTGLSFVSRLATGPTFAFAPLALLCVCPWWVTRWRPRGVRRVGPQLLLQLRYAGTERGVLLTERGILLAQRGILLAERGVLLAQRQERLLDLLQRAFELFEST